MEGKKRIIIGVVVFLVCMIFGVVGYFVYDKILSVDNVKEELNDNNVNEDEIIENNKVNMDNGVIDYVDLNVSYEGNYVDVGKYIQQFNSNDNYKDRLLNLTVDGIVIDGVNYIFKFNKHTRNCANLDDYDSGNYNEVYINDKKIYAQNNQACCLEIIDLITVIDNKYIGVSYKGQGGNYIKIYDKNIKLVDTVNFLNMELSNNKITYTEYEKDNGCLINKYSYTIVDSKPVKTFVEQVSNDICDQMTGKGCCNPASIIVSDDFSYKIVKKFDENGIGFSELYVNDKLVEFEDQTMKYANINVKKFNDDILIVEKSLSSSVLFIVNKKGNVIGVFEPEGSDYYKNTKKLFTKASYRDTYRIEGNSIYIQSDKFGNGGIDWFLCDQLKNDNEIVMYEEKFDYLGNDKFSDSVITKSITRKQYMKDNNISCNK